MRTATHLPEITSTFYQPFHRLAVTLALALGLLAAAVNSRAAVLTWTNTVSDYWADPQAWGTGIVPGPADDATFSATTTFTVTITNNTFLDSIDVKNTVGQILTLDTQGNTIALYKPGTGQPTVFLSGDSSGSTAIVYIVSSTTPGTMICTNAGTSSSNGIRFSAGRSGNGTIVVSNMTVITGGGLFGNNQVICGNSTGPGSQGHIIITGPTTYWTNNASLNIGNNGAATSNLVVISDSASMTCVGTFTTGTSGASGNSLLVDSGGQFYTRVGGTTIGTGSGANNSVTVRNGGLWDLNNTALPIGGTGTGNSLTIGATATVQSVSVATIASGNSLFLAGGLLSTSAGLTNNSGTISGFGTIVGNIVFAGYGTLTLGSGNSVGTLVVSNNVIVTSISTNTTIIKLNKNQAASNDYLDVVGALTEAGTLTVNNVGPGLVGGDTFQIFSSGSPSGNFGTTNLPSLGSQLIWNTSQLGSQGIISIILLPSMTGPADQACFPGSNVTISAVVTGVPVPSLQWQLAGTNLVGATTSSLYIPNAQTTDSGEYCLIASNIGGSVTNCMALSVCAGGCPPTINGPTDQTVIQGNYGTFAASVAGLPAPAIQWQQNGTNIPGATDVPLILTNVLFAQNNYVYSIIASNEAGSATNSATLTVIVTPAFTQQPTNYVATVGQSASFSVSVTGVPTPTYQWYFNNSLIGGATGPTYTIPSVTAANAGTYYVNAINTAATVPSSTAKLTVLSTMTPASITPANSAVNVCYDTPLYITFSQAPVLQDTGTIRIYNVTNPLAPVDTLDMTQNFTNNVPYAVNIQGRLIGGETFNSFPVIISGNTAAMYPHLDVLSSNQTYFVTVDQGVFTDTNGALFAGITTTNGWVFTTKPTGPANPTNIVVAADGSGDFVTVQGAVDSLPANNTTYTLVNIRNGTYTEIVDTKGKNDITFRGQSRSGTIVEYPNNALVAPGGSTHYRMAFKIYANNLAVENMTVANTTAQGGQQSEALMLEAGVTQFILNNAEVDSRQDTIYANSLPQSQGYFYNSLIQGNFDYIWGGGDLFVTNCQFQTIPTASSYNLAAPRTDNSSITGCGSWRGPDGNLSSNGISFVNCLLTRSSSTVSNITMSDSNGFEDGVASWIFCHIDVTGGNGYVTPASNVVATQILWQYGNSNLNNSAAVDLGLTTLTNNDPRLACAGSATCWLYGWVPQLSPNILTNPVSVTVTAAMTATFSVAATGVPDPSYQWLLNGTNVINATASDSTLVISNALAGDAGVYSVIVSNSAGTVTSSNATLTVVGTGPTASFTANPTSGTEPLGVTFTDTSTGSPNITLFWDFGDNSQATNAGGSIFVHTYGAGIYTVTLTASNAFGANSTLVSSDLINVVSPFNQWEANYGLTNAGCTVCGGDASYTGDGMSNTNKFLAGFNPTNSAAYLHVISVARINNGQDIQVTYLGANGDSNSTLGSLTYTNILDYTTGANDGGYSNINFTSTGQINILSGGNGSGVVTNMVDPGGATNVPSRYYRVRVLVP